MRPFKIDKLGNVTDRATGQHLGYVVDTEYVGGYMVSFNHIPLTATRDVEQAWNAYIEEVGCPPYQEFGFRTRAIASNFLWETREYDRKEFPPPPFKRPTLDWRGGWSGGDSEVFYAWSEAHSNTAPSFTKVNTENGERWAVHGLAAELTPGASVEVQRRNGSMSTVELEEVVGSNTCFGTTFVTVLVKKTPRKSTGSGGGYRRSSNQRRSRRWCPVCGEERGSGLFNGWRCNECGWHG